MIAEMPKPRKGKDVSRKRAESKRSLGVDRHLQPRIGFHLPEDLDGALQRYIESLKPAPGKSAIIRAALEEFLEGRGFWPPPADN